MCRRCSWHESRLDLGEDLAREIAVELGHWTALSDDAGTELVSVDTATGATIVQRVDIDGQQRLRLSCDGPGDIGWTPDELAICWTSSA